VKVDSRQLALEWPVLPSLRAEDYVVGACNRLAHDLVLAWPDWPHFALGLSGPAQSGKTHLAHVWAESAGAGVTDAAQVAAVGPDALASRTPRWAVELGEGPWTPDQERALFHLHNMIQAAGGALLYVAREPLARLPVTLPDLRSRLAACPAAAVSAPDEAILRLVIAKLAADRQIVLAEPVIEAVIRRIERSFAAAARFVRAIDAHALAGRRPLTPRLALEVLDALAEGEAEGADQP